VPRRILSAAELARLPGYVADPKGRGYQFDSPSGRRGIAGAMPGDECHEHERWGMINISRCEDAILRESGIPQKVTIDDGMKQNFAAYEFDQSWVDAMTIERRDKPVLFVVGADGAHLIDGTHRLRRRVQDGLSYVHAFLMSPDILRWARVRLVSQQPDGSWKQDGGVSDEELDREIAGAEAIASQIVRPSKR
jgi:hypothetical protein